MSCLNNLTFEESVHRLVAAFINLFLFTFISELPYLVNLDLSNNKLTEIYEKNFQKSLVLQDLNLSNNRIAKIAPKSFETLKMLKTMDMSNNKMETFTAEMFAGNLFVGNKLRKLSLNDNQLTSLKGNLFALLTNLNHLNISNVSFNLLSWADLTSIWIFRIYWKICQLIF